MTKAEMTTTNAMFLLGSPKMPSVPDLVAAVQVTGLRLVMVQHGLWSGAYGNDLLPALEAAGCTIWYHLIPPCKDIATDTAWLDATRTRLLAAKARAAYCDYNEFYAGIKAGTPQWSDDLFRAYREGIRRAIGWDGLLGGSCWMREPDALDVQGTWEPHEHDTARGQAENYVGHSIPLKRQYPSKRVEMGWIGQQAGSNALLAWKPDDYAYVWRRGGEAGLPITYMTTAARLVTEAGIIGKCESLSQAIKG